MDELSSARMSLTAIVEVLGAIADQQLGLATPCRDFTVGDLGTHVVEFVSRLADAADIAVTAPAGTNIARRLTAVTTALLSDWERRGVDGTIDFAGRQLPDRWALGILSLELTVHGWDFATATGQLLPVTDAHAEYVLTLAHRTLTPESRINAGFDQPVVVGSDASALDRLIAFTGRDPRNLLSH